MSARRPMPIWHQVAWWAFAGAVVGVFLMALDAPTGPVSPEARWLLTALAAGTALIYGAIGAIIGLGVALLRVYVRRLEDR